MTMRMASTDQISKCVRYFLIGASLDFLASKEFLILTLPQKVARQLLTVARWPQKINDCAMADRIPIRYDETLLVKHLPSLPVRMRAGSPGARRGFFLQLRTASPSHHPRGNDSLVDHPAQLGLERLRFLLEQCVGRLHFFQILHQIEFLQSSRRFLRRSSGEVAEHPAQSMDVVGKTSGVPGFHRLSGARHEGVAFSQKELCNFAEQLHVAIDSIEQGLPIEHDLVGAFGF